MNMGPGLNRTLLPQGFWASGVNCGVRRYRPDLGLILSDTACVAAGVFTLNECKAAPVLYCQAILPQANVRAIVTNSGQANAATGEQGKLLNQQMVQSVATQIGCEASQVLSASTGVIGAQLEIEKIVAAVPLLVERAQDSAESFALAILTTDLIPKSVSCEVQLSSGTVRLTGICKGSGMIHPNMGTMLGYLLTDARIAQNTVQSLLKTAVDLSFNMISVDGDTSTNDAVFLLANGASNCSVESEADLAIFQAALNSISILLAKSIARDGEGATKLIEVQVRGATSAHMAKQAARAITTSPLIKSAFHGEDPNWGRILAKLGANSVPAALLEQMNLHLQNHLVFAKGSPLTFDRALVRQALKKDYATVLVDLGAGSFEATAWGCDLSAKYVEINAEYS